MPHEGCPPCTPQVHFSEPYRPGIGAPHKPVMGVHHDPHPVEGTMPGQIPRHGSFSGSFARTLSFSGAGTPAGVGVLPHFSTFRGTYGRSASFCQSSAEPRSWQPWADMQRQQTSPPRVQAAQSLTSSQCPRDGGLAPTHSKEDFNCSNSSFESRCQDSEAEEEATQPARPFSWVK
eukprot:NODE_1831_length_1386_cov_19.778609_g1657_i0.p3 GENE.NODE_1831_length_1386_cov_19.778609_g1657_i0~~NODE_1831_length_1386_cov_19.778609_g1657_i0.p3  ORF type:complete len:176 (-),score=17.33 NODE_1831_length_1386_cov_19.778609_g1657_i0:181-708(-)